MVVPRRLASFAAPVVAVAAAVLASACAAAGKVQFVDGRCLIDGAPVTLAQVEARQAAVTEHVLGRQPVLTAIAVAAVALASAGYLQRLWTLVAARRAEDQSLADRLRARMARYRAHPVRYFLLIGSVLALLVLAGVSYVTLDADKRTSERALASLQFCHLALRSADEQRVLAEQREHLASIQSTEHDIQTLVDKLPPAEQDKAHEIVQQLSTTLGQQQTMVARYAEHADDTAKQVAEHQAEVEKGLSKLDGEVVDLKSVPAALGDLAGTVRDVANRQHTLGGEIEAGTAHVDALAKQLDALARQVDALAARPVPAACPTTPTAAPTASPPANTAAAPPTAATSAGSNATTTAGSAAPAAPPASTTPPP